MSPANREALARQIASLEAEGGSSNAAIATIPLQCPAIDAVLPGGGLRTGAVHELLGPEMPADQQSTDQRGADQRGDGAVMGFACGLLARLMRAPEAAGPVVWCMNRHLEHRNGLLSGQVYAPGLHAFGIPMQRLLFVYCNNDQEALWATEEAVRSVAVGSVVAELHGLEALAARRLQLAAQASATTVLAIRPGYAAAAGSFVETRWRVASLASDVRAEGEDSAAQSVAAHWHVSLLRARCSSVTGSWSARWYDRRLLAKPYNADYTEADVSHTGSVVRLGV
jgi:protein ImuA